VSERTEDVVVMGTGCAGLTAGIYTARANLAPLVIEGALPGGQLTTTTLVENFPGFPEGVMGHELIAAMRRQAERFGARFVAGQTTGVDLARRPFRIDLEDRVVETRALIVATGADPRYLGLESEGRLIGRGVSSCATCDGALYRAVPVAVIGGGDSALEEAIFLTKFAARVYVVHRRDQLRASPIMQDRAFANPKIEFVWNSTVREVLGTDELTGLRLRDVRDGAERDLAVKAMFVAIGHVPNTAVFRGHVELDGDGYIVLRHGRRTSVPGVFAAGDVADREYRQAITAAGTGCAAALEAVRFLESEPA